MYGVITVGILVSGLAVVIAYAIRYRMKKQKERAIKNGEQ